MIVTFFPTISSPDKSILPLLFVKFTLLTASTLAFTCTPSPRIVLLIPIPLLTSESAFCILILLALRSPKIAIVALRGFVIASFLFLTREKASELYLFCSFSFKASS